MTAAAATGAASGASLTSSSAPTEMSLSQVSRVTSLLDFDRGVCVVPHTLLATVRHVTEHIALDRDIAAVNDVALLVADAIRTEVFQG